MVTPCPTACGPQLHFLASGTPLAQPCKVFAHLFQCQCDIMYSHFCCDAIAIAVQVRIDHCMSVGPFLHIQLLGRPFFRTPQDVISRYFNMLSAQYEDHENMLSTQYEGHDNMLSTQYEDHQNMLSTQYEDLDVISMKIVMACYQHSMKIITACCRCSIKILQHVINVVRRS